MSSIQKNSALKITLWLTGGALVLVLLNVIGQGLNTLDRLTLVERERDTWQRAPAIVGLLNLHDGGRVVDLGCGAGYFALKLSAAVGARGNVQAVDILRLPLTFLWIRSHQSSFQQCGNSPRRTGRSAYFRFGERHTDREYLSRTGAPGVCACSCAWRAGRRWPPGDCRSNSSQR